MTNRLKTGILHPAGKWVIVIPYPAEEQSDKGIILTEKSRTRYSAGVIREVGPDVQQFAAGEHVFYSEIGVMHASDSTGDVKILDPADILCYVGEGVPCDSPQPS